MDTLDSLLAQRIAVMDGAMGTMIQALGLGEDDYRGDLFRDHSQDIKGNSDILSLTQPAAIRDIHLEYLRAGADIVKAAAANAPRTPLLYRRGPQVHRALREERHRERQRLETQYRRQ